MNAFVHLMLTFITIGKCNEPYTLPTSHIVELLPLLLPYLIINIRVN